jgi:hypothetical protein
MNLTTFSAVRRPRSFISSTVSNGARTWLSHPEEFHYLFEGYKVVIMFLLFSAARIFGA